MLPFPVVPHSSRIFHFSRLCRRQSIVEGLGRTRLVQRINSY